MKFQNLFYTLGIIFLFATVSYFAYSYLSFLSDGIKLAILVLLIIVFFFLGEIMGERDI